MDKTIHHKGRKTKKALLFSGGGLVVIALVILAISSGRSTSVRIEKDKIMTGAVTKGNFSEYILVSGNILPGKTVYLNAPEGGQVEEIFAENGEIIPLNGAVVRLVNTSLQMNYINRQAEILEQINVLRNTKINVEEKSINLREQLLETSYTLKNAEQNYNRNKKLFEKGAVSSAVYDPIKEEYTYLQEKKKLICEKLTQDSLLSKYQLSSINPSLALMQKNLDFIEKSLGNLTIKAPIQGQLSSLNVEIGQNISPGQNIAQVDVWDGFKVKAGVEEYYLNRVFVGQKGYYAVNQQFFDLEITKVYPEVNNGKFNVDMVFSATMPEGLRRGQTLQIKVSLSEDSESLMIPNSGYTAESGGNWVYILNENGQSAVKKNIKTGRQNPDYIEVISGLREGDQIIISDYAIFNNASKVIFK